MHRKATVTVLRDPARLFAPAAVVQECRGDGAVMLRSSVPLGEIERCIGCYLEQWADCEPGRPFLAERPEGNTWRVLPYGEARRRVRRLAAGLLRLGLGPQAPLIILSDNSIDHALMMLAAMHVGIPAVSVSTSYSLASTDHAKLRSIVSLVEPGLVFAEDQGAYARALAAVATVSGAPLSTSKPMAVSDAILLGDLEQDDEDAVAAAFEVVGPDTMAKLLFTSGSTGEPKGVINTQRMLCSNVQARSQNWPFLDDMPPVMVDWLPWSHTFGGNYNFNAVLRHGGTLHIDAGRPAPGRFEPTVRNLREISPTVYANVPRGYDMLVTALRSDRELRESFFTRLQVLFYAAAALPQHLWEALHELSVQTVGERVPTVSAWGATETAPMVTDCHFQAERSGVIGIPVPGSEVKLLPSGAKLEVRVRGPHVTPGYWRRPDLTAGHFDDEGFYKIGDAVRFVDPARPELGLLFDGRVAEDFKLDSGTWVNVGILRVQALAALAPLAQDIVLTGHDRAEIGFLVFPNLEGCRTVSGNLPADSDIEALVSHPAVRERVAEGLARLRDAGQGTSSYATRALFLTEAPSLDAGEITDKGYLNQRAVLARRANWVQALHASTPTHDVILLPSRGSTPGARTP
jgi:feruloyl-CoA synthase